MPPKVLIVDDNEETRLVLAVRLKQLGCWCVLAAGEAQARERLNEHAFELALLALNPSGNLGLGLLRYLVTEYPQIATLVIASADDPLLVDAALEAGAYGYLVKPIRAEELFVHVSCALRRRSCEAKRRARVERLTTALRERTDAFLEARERLGLLEKQLEGLANRPYPSSERGCER